jgi:mRNA-degrading endonuclease toxin of MazEF toxin-antitoxin module
MMPSETAYAAERLRHMERAQKAHPSKAFLGVRAVREVWWCSLGLNVGTEQDGKHTDFERPVLILRKFNRDSVLIAPITSQLKRTSYHVRFTHDGIEYAVIISQVRLLTTRRLRRRIFRMPEDMFGEVLSALQQMIGQGA